jgi:hypothetical protein
MVALSAARLVCEHQSDLKSLPAQALRKTVQSSRCDRAEALREVRSYDTNEAADSTVSRQGHHDRAKFEPHGNVAGPRAVSA